MNTYVRIAVYFILALLAGTGLFLLLKVFVALGITFILGVFAGVVGNWIYASRRYKGRRG